MTDKPRVAVHARSATPPNPNGIAAQIAECKSFSDQQNWDFVLTATEKGIAGTRLERPGHAEILGLVVSGHLDDVLADGPERFARDINVMRTILATSKEHGTKCHALSHNLSDGMYYEPSPASITSVFAVATSKL